MSLTYQRLFIILINTTVIEKEQKREVFLNLNPLILKNELVVKTANTNPDAVFSITVQEYFDRGNAKIEQQDYEGAFAYFSMAIDISRENSLVNFRVYKNG